MKHIPPISLAVALPILFAGCGVNGPDGKTSATSRAAAKKGLRPEPRTGRIRHRILAL